MTFPTGFVGHGSPMNALDPERGATWRAWAADLPTPTAVLSISAHFEQAPPTLSATSTLPLIYDFWGFPQQLYDLEYSAPGAPQVAGTVERLLAGLVTVARDETRGLDHGTWVPLRHMYPEADIPILQLSIPWTDDPHRMFELGRALAPLRAEGVFILGSGNLVHNLRLVDWEETRGTPAWANEFDGWLAEALDAGNAPRLEQYQSHPLAQICHPTREHFVPILTVAGAASEHDQVTYPVEGFELGSISARCVQFG